MATRPLHLRPLLFTLALALILCLSSAVRAQITDSNSTLPSAHYHATGTFLVNGSPADTSSLHPVPGKSLPALWSSQDGSPLSFGTLRLGKFSVDPAKANNFQLAIAGYPTAPGITLVITRLSDGATLPLYTGPDPGPRWIVVPIRLPPDFISTDLIIRATDDARPAIGATATSDADDQAWIGISEPYSLSEVGNADPWWQHRFPAYNAAVWSALLPTIVVIPAILFLIGVAPLLLIPVRLLPAAPLRPALLFVSLAFLSYLAFWVFLASAPAGTALSYAATAASLVIAVLRRGRLATAVGGKESLAVGFLIAVALSLYLGLLLLYQSGSDISFIAAHRNAPPVLPSDNVLTEILANALIDGRDPRPVLGEWQSSDRPPVQVGVQLIGRPLATRLAPFLGPHPFYCQQIAAMYFQASALAAIWGFLRRISVSRRTALAITLALIPTGFLYQNTIFVWPKLAAAAFALTAYTLLFHSRRRSSNPAPASGDGLEVPPSRSVAVVPNRHRQLPVVQPLAASTSAADWPTTALAGLAAALAYLCHSGTAYFLLPIPLLLIGIRRLRSALMPSRRAIIVGVAVFLVMQLPWIAYQKLYDPPGDRLLKWHLAGEQPVNRSESFVALLRQNYGRLGLKQAMLNRVSALRAVFAGDYAAIPALGSLSGPRREEVFFHPVRGQDVYLFSLPIVGFLVLRRTIARQHAAPELHPFFPARPAPARHLARRARICIAALLLVTSTILWILLVFEPGGITTHQFSYASMLLLPILLLLPVVLKVPRVALIIVLINIASFLTLYLPGPSDGAVGAPYPRDAVAILFITIPLTAILVSECVLLLPLLPWQSRTSRSIAQR